MFWLFDVSVNFQRIINIFSIIYANGWLVVGFMADCLTRDLGQGVDLPSVGVFLTFKSWNVTKKEYVKRKELDSKKTINET